MKNFIARLMLVSSLSGILYGNFQCYTFPGGIPTGWPNTPDQHACLDQTEEMNEYGDWVQVTCYKWFSGPVSAKDAQIANYKNQPLLVTGSCGGMGTKS